jgi:hypothetical protein
MIQSHWRSNFPRPHRKSTCKNTTLSRWPNIVLMELIFFIPALISLWLSIIGLIRTLNTKLIGPHLLYLFFFLGDLLISGAFVFDFGNNCLLLSQLRRLGALSKAYCGVISVWSFLSHLFPRDVPLAATQHRILTLGICLFLLFAIPLPFEEYLHNRDNNCNYPFGVGVIFILFFFVPQITMFLFCVTGTMYALRKREPKSDLVNSLSAPLYERLYVINFIFTISLLLAAPYYLTVMATNPSETIPQLYRNLVAFSSPFAGIVGASYIIISPWADRMRRVNLYFVNEYYFRDSAVSEDLSAQLQQLSPDPPSIL